ARLAVAALDHFKVKPGLLHAGTGLCRANVFDGGDCPFAYRCDWEQTGAHWITIDVHGAGAALGDAAAGFRAGQPQHVTQHPEQRRGGVDINRVRGSVDFDWECHRGPQSRLMATSMLLRVAFEYGQILCASSIRARAVARSMPGRLMLSRALRK